MKEIEAYKSLQLKLIILNDEINKVIIFSHKYSIFPIVFKKSRKEFYCPLYNGIFSSFNYVSNNHFIKFHRNLSNEDYSNLYTLMQQSCIELFAIGMIRYIE